jgi:phosphoesterase RecJ-like protein
MPLPLKDIREKISSANEIVVACHINPDGDAIGSLLSLGRGLKDLGKKVYMISMDGVPEMYVSLPGADEVVKEIKKKPELAISVDCSTKQMLGKTYDTFRKAKYIIEIDHHQNRESFGDLSIVDTKAAAVGEIIYRILKKLDIKVGREIAMNILASIIVETNSFRLPNVRANTFSLCAELLKTGVDFNKLAGMIFWSRTREAVVLSGLCLSRCRFLKKGKIAWTIVYSEDFNEAKAKYEDVETVVGEILSIQDVEASVFFKERYRDELRVSLRSKGKVDVGYIAKKFGGGGHFNAAGCSIPRDEAVIKQILHAVEDIII